MSPGNGVTNFTGIAGFGGGIEGAGVTILAGDAGGPGGGSLTDHLLLVDGSSSLLMVDGSSFLLLEV